MRPVTLERARAAKRKIAALLDDLPELRGLGIAVLEGGYGVKVNLLQMPPCPIPSDIDGVPVIVEIIGPIRA